jgi:20S proteasome subunit beta 3
VIAMAGKDCVAIASDLRFGIKNNTVGFDHSKVYRMNSTTFVGLPGLISDAQTLYEKLAFRLNLYELSEDKEMTPQTFASMVQSVLYEKRFGPFFVEPVIAGLDATGKPYLCGMDLIGAPESAQDFILAGTSAQAMFGLAETLWRPNMNPDELFETISQTLLTAVDRDAIAGWGARVHIITKDKVITRDLKARQD